LFPGTNLRAAGKRDPFTVVAGPGRGRADWGKKKASRGTKKKVAGTMMKKIHQFSRRGLRGARGAS